MKITEPKWKSYVVETIGPIFTAKLCKEIIDLSSTLKKEQGKVGPVGKEVGDNDKKRRHSTIRWIPFNKMQPMYDDLIDLVQKINRNHFGFSNVQITEPAQVSEYSKGQFYHWHTDSFIDMDREPTVRIRESLQYNYNQGYITVKPLSSINLAIFIANFIFSLRPSSE